MHIECIDGAARQPGFGVNLIGRRIGRARGKCIIFQPCITIEDRPEIFDLVQIWRERRPNHEPFVFAPEARNILVICAECAGALSCMNIN